ncbi:Outer envelope pore protein 24A, chloroplastic [Sarracenia purpurea var. burkii]
MKASLKGRCEIDKVGAVCSVAINAGDVKVRASMTDATFVSGPSLNGLSLSLEKLGSFIIDYNVPEQDVQFQFMDTVRILDKPLNLVYAHGLSDKWTVLNGALVLDSANKLSANYAFPSKNCKVKYTYVHKGASTFEPSYDFAKNSWDFAVSQRLSDDDAVRTVYQTSSKVLGLEWLRNSLFNGTFKL